MSQVLYHYDSQHCDTQCYAEGHCADGYNVYVIMLSAVLLYVVLLGVILLSGIMFGVIMLNFIMLSAIMVPLC
jgi:hypothetical protein